MAKYIKTEDELTHWGVLGMKWGVRKDKQRAVTLSPDPKDSSVTKKVKKDYNQMSDSDFRKKYGASKDLYAKRVSKYGDPYMNAPLAKIGKFMEKQAKQNAERYMESAQKKENKKLQTKGKSYAEVTLKTSKGDETWRVYGREEAELFKELESTGGFDEYKNE